MSDKKNFADIWNYYIHGGRQVIKPEDLVDKDPVEEAVMKKFKTIVTAQKYRDILKGVTIKSDGRRVYAILGIENQSDIHYAMPVRNSLYDALDYAAQVTEIARQNRKAKKAKNSAEFLSGFTEKDKLIPVITLVINWGDKKWDGPVSLLEMMDDLDPDLAPFVNDYRMNLVDPHTIEDFDKFTTELGDVFEFIRRQNSDKDLQAMLDKKGPNWGLAPESVNVINTFTGAKISLDDKEGDKIIMCKGIEMMIEEGRKEGRKEALKEGIEGAVNILRGLGQSDEEIAAAICRQFDLKPEEAKKYM
jgi:hypothetical protein